MSGSKARVQAEGVTQPQRSGLHPSLPRHIKQDRYTSPLRGMKTATSCFVSFRLSHTEELFVPGGLAKTLKGVARDGTQS